MSVVRIRVFGSFHYLGTLVCVDEQSDRRTDDGVVSSEPRVVVKDLCDGDDGRPVGSSDGTKWFALSSIVGVES